MTDITPAPSPAPAQTSSPKWSFAGYSILVAVQNNAELIALYLSALAAYTAKTGFNWKDFLTLLAIGGIGLVAKLLVDAVRFWAKNVKLNPPAQ